MSMNTIRNAQTSHTNDKAKTPSSVHTHLAEVDAFEIGTALVPLTACRRGALS